MIASLYQRGSSVSAKSSGGIMAITPVGEPQRSPRSLVRHCIRRSAPQGSGRVPRRPAHYRPLTRARSLAPDLLYRTLELKSLLGATERQRNSKYNVYKPRLDLTGDA